MIAWGDNSNGQTNVPAGLSNVVALGAGDHHNCALKADGTRVAVRASTSQSSAMFRQCQSPGCPTWLRSLQVGITTWRFWAKARPCCKPPPRTPATRGRCFSLSLPDSRAVGPTNWNPGMYGTKLSGCPWTWLLAMAPQNGSRTPTPWLPRAIIAFGAGRHYSEFARRPSKDSLGAGVRLQAIERMPHPRSRCAKAALPSTIPPTIIAGWFVLAPEVEIGADNGHQDESRREHFAWCPNWREWWPCLQRWRSRR